MTTDRVHTTDPTGAEPLTIGGGFKALSFRERHFGGLMDPLVMVDHYTMTEPTFGAHPHAGMSAISVLFEDSEGRFNNRDSLGNDIDLLPGDLYWLKAGRGAVHSEEPVPGSRIHGLQIFVNLPARLKHSEPASLHVRAADIPAIEGPGHKVRVLLGASQGVQGAQSPALPLTILDGKLTAGAGFIHDLTAGRAAWLYAISGDLEVRIGSRSIRIAKGKAVALHTGEKGSSLSLHSVSGSHFALIEGDPIRESFIQKGPFVMSTADELERVSADYAAGRLGSIA